MDKNFGDVIYSYTQDEAVKDGALDVVGKLTGTGGKLIVFTRGLMEMDEYEKSQEARTMLIEKGLNLLKIPNKEDTNYMMLRVIEKGKIWVIADGNGLTFMRPEDY